MRVCEFESRRSTQIYLIIDSDNFRKRIYNYIMAYKFNSGHGAVICDKCNIIIDAGLSYNDYVENYKAKKNICWKCKNMKNTKECKNCGSTEFDSEGKCLYCKCHIGKKKSSLKIK